MCAGSWLRLLLLSANIVMLQCTVCSKDKVIGMEKSKDDPDKVDRDKSTSFMVRDPAYIVPCCGVISKWTVFVMEPGTIQFRVWRDLGTGSYTFIGENFATYHPGEEEHFYSVIVENEEKIPVKTGDYIGWYTSAKSVPGYINEKKGFGALSASLGKKLKVGDAVDWSEGTVSGPRSYGLAATVTKDIPPKFKNLDSDIEISDDIPPGSSVYTLTFVGFEIGYFPHNYIVVMDTVTEYFEYNLTSNSVLLIKQPPVNKMVLDFIVKDHCETSAKGHLKIEVISKTPHIRNLPSSAFVREDVHRVEILLKEVNATYRDNLVCVLHNVNPTKSASLFTMRAIPDVDFVYGVYLKSSADLDYDSHDLYVISVKCSEGKTSDTQDLYVYIEANKAPVFVNVPGSFHVDAKTAQIAESLYQVNATDAENNVIRHKLVCDNATPCPFNITKDGTVYLQTSLNRTIAKIVYLNITIEDSFNFVGPNTLVANITNFNRLPYIEDLTDIVVSLHENSPEGMPLYVVSAHDPDEDDVITYSLDVKPSKMREYFAINETTGVITSVTSVDFEGVKFRVTKLIVSVSDGKDVSSSFLRVALVDENEPPEFIFGRYSMHIPEGNPSPKNDLRIKAKDLDKVNTVSFGMECENGSGTFQINENSGLVSQVLAVDVDPLNVSELVIECNITAADVGGLASYAPLTIVIDDVNDNSPNFPKTSYMFVVSDFVPVYSEIGTVQAIDKDTSPENNLIFYQINAELDEFIIDENGTIYMMKDVTEIPFGTVFKYNITAEDVGTLSDVVPVTIVVIYNMDPNFMIAGSGFLSFPENVVWVITAAYLLFIIVGIIFFYLVYYFHCSFRRKRRKVGNTDSQSRRMSVHSALSSKVYTNVYDENTSRDIIMSPVSYLRYPSLPKTLTNNHRPASLIPIDRTFEDDKSEVIMNLTSRSITSRNIVSRQSRRSTEGHRNEDVMSIINGSIANRNITSRKSNLTSRQSRRSIVTSPSYRSSPLPRVVSMEITSVTTDDVPCSPVPISRSKVTSRSRSKCSLSEINPSGSGSWKPWSVNDFQAN